MGWDGGGGGGSAFPGRPPGFLALVSFVCGCWKRLKRRASQVPAHTEKSAGNTDTDKKAKYVFVSFFFSGKVTFE